MGLLTVFVLAVPAAAQFRTTQNLPFLTPNNCSVNQFFNLFEFNCIECSNGTLPHRSRLACRCPEGQKTVSDVSAIPTCQQCAQGQILSPDGRECVRARENSTTECSADEVLLFRSLQGGIDPQGAACVVCSNGTRPNTDASKCEPCEPTNSCACMESCRSTDTLKTTIRLQSGVEYRSKVIDDLLPISVNLCALGSVQHCQALVNLCVLQNFEREVNNACGLLEDVRRTKDLWETLDPLFFSGDADSEMGKEVAITQQFLFDDSPNSVLQIFFATYKLNGEFEGFLDAPDVQLHFCQSDVADRAPYRFGRRYHRECKFYIDAPFNRNAKGLFYEPFVKFFDENGYTKMYPIAVLNRAIRANNQFVNRLPREQNRWILTRRFFLLDDYSIVVNNVTLLRVASAVRLLVTLQRAGDGLIHPPLLELDYDDADDKAHITSSFRVTYDKDPSAFDRDLEIIMFVLCPLSVIWAAMSAYSWGRRSGKASAVDASAILQMLLFECGLLGDVFFIVIAGIAVWLTFAYKWQTYVFYNIINDRQERVILTYLIVACCLKFVSLLHNNVLLIFQETFFIDWERRRVKRNEELRPASRDAVKEVAEEPIVVWRTYMIANEWNELQQYRKTSLNAQIVVFLVLHEYLQVKNFALVEPGFRRNIDDDFYESTLLTRFSVAVFLYLLIAFGQWVVQVLVVERIVVDPFHNFIDLCSFSNISVMSLTETLHGYYIHGRSVHGKADAGMAEMNEFLQRERDNLCGFRGLEPSTELQTFIINLPTAFRRKYDEIRRTVSQPNALSSSSAHDSITAKMNATAKARDQMNAFLKDFVDHSLADVDFVVRDRTLLEALLDVEMNDTSQVGNFHRDNSEMLFSRCFVYGNEWKWLSFETLLFCVVFLLSASVHLALFVVFIVSKFTRLAFRLLSTNHLVRSSLVDHRFLV